MQESGNFLFELDSVDTTADNLERRRFLSKKIQTKGKLCNFHSG